MVEDYVEEHPILDIIREYICEIYGAKYVKRFRLYLDGDSYSIYFELNNWDKPIMLGGQFESDEDFINYIKKELRVKAFHRTEYFSGYQQIQGEGFTIGLNDPRIEDLKNEHCKKL